MLGNALLSDCRLDLLEIDTDLPAARDRVQDEAVGARDIEPELRVTVRGRQCGLAAAAVVELQPTRIRCQVAPEDGPEPPTTDNEAVAVSPKGESLRRDLFAQAQGLAPILMPVWAM